MQFGRLNHIILDDVDFSLPPDTEGTKRILSGQQSDNDFQVFVGAPKWSHKGWLGKIYPLRTREDEFLKFYCKNFNTIEFGPTFYNVYKAEALSRWINQCADHPDFRFSPKFPQHITHLKRLVGAQEYTAEFYESLAAFGDQLGPLLLQLGDNFPPKNFPQLKAYLESLPKGIKVNVEVRHRDWFSDALHRDQLFDLLRSLGIGTVISDTAGRRDTLHMELTTKEAYIRFIGNDLIPSDYTRMDEWVDRLKQWKDMGLKKVWFFMHQDDETFVPKACDYLIGQLNEKLGTNISKPQFLNKDA